MRKDDEIQQQRFPSESEQTRQKKYYRNGCILLGITFIISLYIPGVGWLDIMRAAFAEILVFAGIICLFKIVSSKLFKKATTWDRAILVNGLQFLLSRTLPLLFLFGVLPDSFPLQLLVLLFVPFTGTVFFTQKIYDTSFYKALLLCALVIVVASLIAGIIALPALLAFRHLH